MIPAGFLSALAALTLMQLPHAARAADGAAPTSSAQGHTPITDSTEPAGREYLAIQIEPLQLVHTIEVNEPADTVGDRATPNIKPDDLERIRRQFRSAFESELVDAFDVTSAPGPATLRLEAMLIGLELDRQKWLAPATRRFSTVDTVTLVVVVSDSASGEVQYRVAIKDGPVANHLQLESATLYWEHLRKLFRRLAIRVRWQLTDPPEEPASSQQRGAPAAASD
jgi:hypothetical protein